MSMSGYIKDDLKKKKMDKKITSILPFFLAHGTNRWWSESVKCTELIIVDQRNGLLPLLGIDAVCFSSFFFLVSHLLLLFNCYPSLGTLIFFIAGRRIKKKCRTLSSLISIDFFIIDLCAHVPHYRWWDYWYYILLLDKKYRCRSNT